MTCEHVEDWLSAYLDDALAPEEYRAVAAHLAVCPRCNAVLADFRRFDALLSQLPRVNPDAALHERLFYSLPRSSSSLPSVQTAAPLRRGARGQRIMQMMIAATLLLTLGVGGFIALNLRREQAQTAHYQQSIPPPAGLQQGPLPAGIRFVFLRDGALWSASVEGAGQIARLTPTNDTVLSLHWLGNTDMLAITWSVGTPKHIHSLWIRYVGRAGTARASMLTIGDYTQAVYTPDYGQKGSWLLLTQSARQLLLVNLNAQVRALTTGTQISSFSWSPHGSYVDYFDTGALHVLSILNGGDTLLTTNAVDSPVPPVWSADGQRLLYSTGTRIFSADIQAKTAQALAIKGEDIRAPLLWTQVP